MMVALILSTLFGATAQVPVRIKAYLVAVCAAAPILWLGAHWFGESSLAYGIEYSAVTCVTVFAALCLVVHARLTILTAVIGIGTGLLIAIFAYKGLPHPMPFYDVIYLCETPLVGACGAALLFQSAEMPRKDIYVSVAFLWLLQSLFRATFALHSDSQEWILLNERIPALLVCAAFVWVGCRARLNRDFTA